MQLKYRFLPLRASDEVLHAGGKDLAVVVCATRASDERHCVACWVGVVGECCAEQFFAVLAPDDFEGSIERVSHIEEWTIALDELLWKLKRTGLGLLLSSSTSTGLRNGVQKKDKRRHPP